jgi:hypothetical protein
MIYAPTRMGHPMNWGIFTKVKDEDADLQNANQNVSISLSVTSTAFQSEMLAIATAAASLLQHDCKMLSIISDSRSALQSLQNPAIRTKTKLDCMKSINQLAQTNHLDLLWVPGRCLVLSEEAWSSRDICKCNQRHVQGLQHISCEKCR